MCVIVLYVFHFMTNRNPLCSFECVECFDYCVSLTFGILLLRRLVIESRRGPAKSETPMTCSWIGLSLEGSYKIGVSHTSSKKTWHERKTHFFCHVSRTQFCTDFLRTSLQKVYARECAKSFCAWVCKKFLRTSVQKVLCTSVQRVCERELTIWLDGFS